MGEFGGQGQAAQGDYLVEFDRAKCHWWWSGAKKRRRSQAAHHETIV